MSLRFMLRTRENENSSFNQIFVRQHIFLCISLKLIRNRSKIVKNVYCSEINQRNKSKNKIVKNVYCSDINQRNKSKTVKNMWTEQEAC